MTIAASTIAANDNPGCVDPEALARVRVMMHPPHRIHLTELLQPRQPLANENRDWRTMTIPKSDRIRMQVAFLEPPVDHPLDAGDRRPTCRPVPFPSRQPAVDVRFHQINDPSLIPEAMAIIVGEDSSRDEHATSR